jgi:5-methylcytosine-specific restriction protein A
MPNADRRLNLKEWRTTRRLVLVRDGYHCQVMGPNCIGRATTADHIIPRCEGGAMLDMSNLRAACRPCNSSGGAMLANERRRGRAIGSRSREW